MTDRSRYSAAESAEMTVAPSRSRHTPASVVLPDAVGPKIARTLRGSRLLEAMLELVADGGTDELPVLLRMRSAPLLEPCDGLRDAVAQRRLRLPAEQVARLADVCDIVRHLAEQRRRDR